MIARKNTLAGTKEYHVAFGEDSYTVVTAATTSTFRYELIDALAESQDYIILLMKKRYVQPLDKRIYYNALSRAAFAYAFAYGSGGAAHILAAARKTGGTPLPVSDRRVPF